jgi:hypothetical protein
MPDRWQQIEKICQSALELAKSRRRAFLDEACAGDQELRREVESLLQFDSRGDRFIEQPALEVAAKMVAQEPQSLIEQQLGSYQKPSFLVRHQAEFQRRLCSVAYPNLVALTHAGLIGHSYRAHQSSEFHRMVEIGRGSCTLANVPAKRPVEFSDVHRRSPKGV